MADLMPFISRMQEVIKEELKCPTGPWAPTTGLFAGYTFNPDSWYSPTIVEEEEEEHSIQLLDSPLVKPSLHFKILQG